MSDPCGCDKECNWICERHLTHAKEIRVNWGNCADDPRIHPTGEARTRILPPNSMSLSSGRAPNPDSKPRRQL